MKSSKIIFTPRVVQRRSDGRSRVVRSFEDVGIKPVHITAESESLQSALNKTNTIYKNRKEPEFQVNASTTKAAQIFLDDKSEGKDNENLDNNDSNNELPDTELDDSSKINDNITEDYVKNKSNSSIATGFYPTSLPFTKPAEDGSVILSLQNKHTIYDINSGSKMIRPSARLACENVENFHNAALIFYKDNESEQNREDTQVLGEDNIDVEMMALKAKCGEIREKMILMQLPIQLPIHLMPKDRANTEQVMKKFHETTPDLPRVGLYQDLPPYTDPNEKSSQEGDKMEEHLQHYVQYKRKKAELAQKIASLANANSGANPLIQKNTNIQSYTELQKLQSDIAECDNILALIRQYCGEQKIKQYEDKLSRQVMLAARSTEVLTERQKISKNAQIPVDSSLAKLPDGHIGVLRIHKSGKVTMKLNGPYKNNSGGLNQNNRLSNAQNVATGIEFRVMSCGDLGYNQEIMAVDPANGVIETLGPVYNKAIVALDVAQSEN